MGNEKTKTVKMPIKQAYKQLCDDEAAKLVNQDELKTKAIEEWKLSNPPNIHKSPTIFLIHAR